MKTHLIFLSLFSFLIFNCNSDTPQIPDVIPQSIDEPEQPEPPIFDPSRELQKLLDDPGLSGGKVNLDDMGSRVYITGPGRGVEDFDQLQQKLHELQSKVHKLTKNSYLQVTLEFEKSPRQAKTLWNERYKRFYTFVGNKNILLPRRDEYEIELEQTIHLQPLSESLDHKGVIRNISDKTQSVALWCRPKTFTQFRDQAPPDAYNDIYKLQEYRGIKNDAQLASHIIYFEEIGPNKEKRYDFSEVRKKHGSFDIFVYIDGHQSPVFDAYDAQDKRDWIRVLDGLEKLGIYQYPNDSHRPPIPLFSITKEFDSLPEEKRAEIAETIFESIRDHYRNFHNCKTCLNVITIGLYSGKTWAWDIDRGKLKKHTQPDPFDSLRSLQTPPELKTPCKRGKKSQNLCLENEKLQ